MLLSLYHDVPDSQPHFARFEKERVLERLQELDARVRRDGIESLDPKKDLLVSIGTEWDAKGRVTRYLYGALSLAWRAQEHPEWPAEIVAETAALEAQIRAAHKVPLRFLLWAGMGGSAEDKSMYNAAGLLRRGVRCYVLDSTDPAKLKHILEEMQRRSGLPLPGVLRSTRIVGMAVGMTSYEPVVNLERLAALYDRHKINSLPNFLYMTLPGSLLDRFASARGYRRVELQPDDANTMAGRHSGPLSRGSLYPLALARVDLRTWIEGAFLSQEEIASAWRLAAFLHAQGVAGRDKVTLLLPKEWTGAGIWTKQDFEESLGKSEELGIKIVLEGKPKLANYRSPKDPRRQRSFLAALQKGGKGPEVQKVALLRRSAYPLAVITVPPRTPLSRYMQFIHYTVFGVAYLRKMNFVTQPSVELYKSIANRIHAESQKAGGIEKTTVWQAMHKSDRQCAWRGTITLRFDRLCLSDEGGGADAPQMYARFLERLAKSREIDYGELTFFGDTRYSPAGRRVRRCLEHAAETVFRARLKMPVDVYEGPAVNHSYHEMIIGRGRCFSTVLISDKPEQIPMAGYTADYHRAQFLATQMALQDRSRPVVALTLRDMSESTIERLDDFFRQVANALKGYKI